MNFNKKSYERLSESLQTSEQFLFAIEKVAGCELETTEGDQLFDNSAKELWENGGRENEILAALPTETAEDGEKVFWGWLSAEFNNEQWIKCD